MHCFYSEHQASEKKKVLFCMILLLANWTLTIVLMFVLWFQCQSLNIAQDLDVQWLDIPANFSSLTCWSSLSKIGLGRKYASIAIDDHTAKKQTNWSYSGYGKFIQAGDSHRCSVVTIIICKIMVVIACFLIQAGVTPSVVTNCKNLVARYGLGSFLSGCLIPYQFFL